jgi:hypothetical protein
MNRLIGLGILLLGAAGFAFAGLAPAAPEIDASAGVAAMTLLAGGLIVLRGRRRPK